MESLDAIVIGAGAAGIAAARALAAAGRAVVVLEARDRVGGRAFTDETLAAHPVELGAEFIHGENVATWDWVRAYNAPVTGEAHRYEQWFHWGGQLLDSEAFYLQAGDLYREQYRVRADRARHGQATTVAEAFDEWQAVTGSPLASEGRRLVDNMVAQGTSADPAELGLSKGTQATYAGDGSVRHFRLLAGYSDLVRRAADGLDIRLRTPVTRIDWDDDGAEVRAGTAVFRASAVVVTLPLGVLKRGDVEFQPALLAEWQKAIEGINAGAIGKVILRFDEVRWPPGMTFLWTSLPTQLWWRPGQGQEREDAVVTAFFGGGDALEMAARQPSEAARHAVADLEAITGKRLQDSLQDYRVMAWPNEEFTRMGYSSLPPGGEGLREALARPAGALHFAGEATSSERPATVHGALESGTRAAKEILGDVT